MNYVDFTIAASLFLVFFALAIIFSTNYFSNIFSLTKTTEFRFVSEDFFRLFFEGKGVPEDWNKNYSIVPVKIGLAEDLYLIRILVRENAGLNRTDEPVSLSVKFDENCQNKSWNNTIRMYDEDWNELNIEISNKTICYDTQYLKQSDISWKVNHISANQTKKYWIYYSPDETIAAKNYLPLVYVTSSWIPNDGDAWTETTTDWSRYGGTNGTVTTDSINRIRGDYSINITGNFDSSSLGLRYNPANNITGVSNGWHLDFWIYIDDISNLKSVIVRLNDNNESIYVNISSNLTSGSWFHFEKELRSTEWLNWTSFNASNGIDFIDFYMENNSADLTKTIKVDGLHFKKKPLEVKAFPEEYILSISHSKFDVLKNISYDEVRKTVGGNYKLRVEIGNESYGGDFNTSANVGCREYPKIVEYKNGTISKSLVRMCVWK
jgi:hypothetical protein